VSDFDGKDSDYGDGWICGRLPKIASGKGGAFSLWDLLFQTPPGT